MEAWGLEETLLCRHLGVPAFLEGLALPEAVGSVRCRPGMLVTATAAAVEVQGLRWLAVREPARPFCPLEVLRGLRHPRTVQLATICGVTRSCLHFVRALVELARQWAHPRWVQAEVAARGAPFGLLLLAVRVQWGKESLLLCFLDHLGWCRLVLRLT